jgi:hypothetical protein
MPQRPSKKIRKQPGAKTDIVQGHAGGDQAAQLRYGDKTARAIIGKFQGRKSIDR